MKEPSPFDHNKVKVLGVEASIVLTRLEFIRLMHFKALNLPRNFYSDTLANGEYVIMINEKKVRVYFNKGRLSNCEKFSPEKIWTQICKYAGLSSSSPLLERTSSTNCSRKKLPSAIGRRIIHNVCRERRTPLPVGFYSLSSFRDATTTTTPPLGLGPFNYSSSTYNQNNYPPPYYASEAQIVGPFNCRERKRLGTLIPTILTTWQVVNICRQYNIRLATGFYTLYEPPTCLSKLVIVIPSRKNIFPNLRVN